MKTEQIGEGFAYFAWRIWYAIPKFGCSADCEGCLFKWINEDMR